MICTKQLSFFPPHVLWVFSFLQMDKVQVLTLFVENFRPSTQVLGNVTCHPFCFKSWGMKLKTCNRFQLIDYLKMLRLLINTMELGLAFHFYQFTAWFSIVVVYPLKCIQCMSIFHIFQVCFVRSHKCKMKYELNTADNNIFERMFGWNTWLVSIFYFMHVKKLKLIDFI